MAKQGLVFAAHNGQTHTERGSLVRGDKQLERKRSEEVKVVWVKGHGTKELVDTGVTTEVDAWGNAGAVWVSQYAVRNCNTLPLDYPDAWGG